MAVGLIPPDAIAVNLVRFAGLDKHKARECEAIVRQVLAAHGVAPSEACESSIQRDTREIAETFARAPLFGMQEGVPTWQQRAAERAAFERGVSVMRDVAVTVIRARHESGYSCDPWKLVEAIRAAKEPTDPAGVMASGELSGLPAEIDRAAGVPGTQERTGE